MIPGFAIHHVTTSHPHDANGTGPEYAGRVLCIAWLGWVFEFTIARRTK